MSKTPKARIDILSDEIRRKTFRLTAGELGKTCEVEYTLECLPETRGPDRDIERVRRELEHNVWAWCVVKVTARVGDWKGCDYLGCCDYGSEEAFRQGPYDEMKRNALGDLMEELANDALKGLQARRIIAALARN